MASKRRIRNKECTGKVQYKTMDSAYSAIRRIQKESHKGVMNVYRCNFCSFYHIGHTPGKNKIGDGWRYA